jgi:hypothetical protein
MKENTKPKDQHWTLYKKQARNLVVKLKELDARLDRIKAIHFEQAGICKQCQDVYPCTTRKLCDK